MATRIGEELNADLLDRLRGRPSGRMADMVVLLLTVDEAGWPHVACLSRTEIAAIDARTLRIATDGRSSTTANLRRTGRLTAAIFDEGVAYYVKGDAAELAASMAAAPEHAMHNVIVRHVLADRADPRFEAGARIESGIRYTRSTDAPARERAERVLDELLSA